MYTRLVTALVMDDRMPMNRKALLAGAAGYLVLGRDIIPDDVPIIGGLDDLVVVILASSSSSMACPTTCSNEKLDELGIERAEFDRDVAQVRRLTPGPVRRTIRRVPELIGGVGEASNQLGLGPRTRPGSTGRIAAREGHPHEGRAQARQERDMKQVADGYATNFLIPQQLAVPAPGGCLPGVAARHRQPRGQAQARARGGRDRRDPDREHDPHDGCQGRRGRQALRLDHLEGHRDALARRGIDVDRHKIDLEEPLKTLGTYKVAIKVFTGMTPEVTIVVEPKG
jgi:large subunit ribosomal protein L9